MLIYWWRNPPAVTILRGKITRVDPIAHPQDTPTDVFTAENVV